MANMTTQEILQGIKDWAAPKVIYDISAAHNNTKYTDLSDALGTDGGNIPQEYRKGGITVRYVQSSDNKYVQYRLMLFEFTAAQFKNTANWRALDSIQVGYALPINGTFNYDSSTKTLSIPASFDVVSQINSTRYTYSGGDVTFASIGDREQLLIFNTTTKIFRTIGGNTHFIELVPDDVILGTVDTTNNVEYFNFPYSRDAFNIIRNGYDSAPTENSNKLLTSGTIKTIVDTINNDIDDSNNNPKEFNLVGQGTTQIQISLPKQKGLYILNTDWIYTASAQAKLIINANKSGTITRLGLLADNITKEIFYKVEDDYDSIALAVRINQEENVKLILERVITKYSTVGYAIPIQGSFSYDSATRTLTTPTKFDVVGGHGSGRVSVNDSISIQFVNTGSREQLLVFDWGTKQLSTHIGDKSGILFIQERYIILGTVDTTTGLEYFNFSYTKDGLGIIRNGYDNAPVRNSTNLLTSGAIFEAINSLGSISNSVVSLASHAAYGKDVFLRSFIEDYFDNIYWNLEESTYNTFLTKIQARKSNSVLQIAFVTDTHEGGQYAENGTFAFRNVALFNKLSEYVDICAHGGDISCDYDTSLERQFAYLMDIMKMYKPQKPFLITKGNHDQRDKGYSEVSPLNVDWDNGTYYVSPSFNVFQQVTKDIYRGGQLYIADGKGFMPDSWFRFIQANNAPVDAVWGDGAYYYWDNDTIKIRFIVRNSFPVNDSGVVDESDEWKWFAEKALDLSDKATPTDWLVVCLGHTEVSSSAKFGTVVEAFMQGNSMTIDEATVDYGTLNGGGIKFIHIHGHEHGTAGYSNMAGYLDIGFRNANIDKGKLGHPSYYNIYIISIDTNNDMMIVDNMRNNETYQYNYSTNILELPVGETALMARSGLSGQSGSGYTWTSSDNNIATVANGIVTGVSTGVVTITGVQLSNQKTVTYTVKVVS